jgi:hypothetical protein
MICSWTEADGPREMGGAITATQKPGPKKLGCSLTSDAQPALVELGLKVKTAKGTDIASGGLA